MSSPPAPKATEDADPAEAAPSLQLWSVGDLAKAGQEGGPQTNPDLPEAMREASSGAALLQTASF